MKPSSIHRASGVLLLLATPLSCSASKDIVRASISLSAKDLICPADCGDIFNHLDRDGIQTTEVQIRGEPKSGTGTSEEWAAAALHATCDYLKRLYGGDSCWMNSEEKFYTEMVFEPGLASYSPCSCTNVERVNISVGGHSKHVLPVDNSDCEYRHPGDIATSTEGMCNRQDSRPLENQVDLWRCVEEAGCTITDSRLQLAVMRDPRAVTVSAYFHLSRNYQIPSDMTVDQYFQQNLELMCQWVSLRYFFFTQIMAGQSELFWYGDHEDDPLDWHRRYLGFVGLNVPLDETVAVAWAASEGEIANMLGYRMKGMDRHPDGRENLSKSTFKDELGQESLQMMDEVLRRWLPPVVLRRLGVLLV